MRALTKSHYIFDRCSRPPCWRSRVVLAHFFISRQKNRTHQPKSPIDFQETSFPYSTFCGLHCVKFIISPKEAFVIIVGIFVSSVPASDCGTKRRGCGKRQSFHFGWRSIAVLGVFSTLLPGTTIRATTLALALQTSRRLSRCTTSSSTTPLGTLSRFQYAFQPTRSTRSTISTLKGRRKQ